MIWNTRGFHNIFKLKYESCKLFRRLDRPTCFIIKRMFLLVGRPLQSEKTKAFVKYLASSSFKFRAT